MWPPAHVVIGVDGEVEQELESQCVNKDTAMLRCFLQKTSESTFSKLEIELIHSFRMPLLHLLFLLVESSKEKEGSP